MNKEGSRNVGGWAGAWGVLSAHIQAPSENSLWEPTLPWASTQAAQIPGSRPQSDMLRALRCTGKMVAALSQENWWWGGFWGWFHSSESCDSHVMDKLEFCQGTLVTNTEHDKPHGNPHSRQRHFWWVDDWKVAKPSGVEICLHPRSQHGREQPPGTQCGSLQSLQ